MKFDATADGCGSCDCCSGGSMTNELCHGFHRGYSSIKSHIINDASVPPTVISDRSPHIKRTLPIGPEYVFTSLYSLRGLIVGYLSIGASNKLVGGYYKYVVSNYLNKRMYPSASPEASISCPVDRVLVLIMAAEFE